MVCTFGWTGALCFERCGRAPVRRDSPAPAGGFVDRAAYQRVAEHEPPRHLCRADQIAVEQVIERREPVVRAELGCRGRHLGLEWFTGDGGAFQEQAGGGWE